MNTPISDFLLEYAKRNSSRLHMPGHKGKLDGALATVAPLDITEIRGADVLFCADSIIEQSEANTAMLYNAKHTCFSTQGSTTCIMAMLRLVAHENDTIISARNVHHAFINACALLGVNPQFIYPTDSVDGFTTAMITANQVAEELSKTPTAKAVYITSPDYLGVMSDIKGIADVCKQYDIPLLVDNAHGAYLPKSLHPITNGATLCCDSAHKTLPVLTGGAYLHTAVNSKFTKAEVKSAMSLFSSTSPSYLTLMSLDQANIFLQNERDNSYQLLCERIKPLQQLAVDKGYRPLSEQIEPAKLTLILGDASDHKTVSDMLIRYNIEPEYLSDEVLVLMFSAHSTVEDYYAVSSFLKAIPDYKNASLQVQEMVIPQREMTVRQAVLSDCVTVPIEKSVGRIAGETKLRCPPGVPLIIPGEIIDIQLHNFLKKCSIFDLSVIK